MPLQISPEETQSNLPRLLFHGSPRKDLTLLRPGDLKPLHASDDIRLAVAFLARPEDCYCVRTKGEVRVWVAEEKEEFRRRDNGGAIYVVDGSNFVPVNRKCAPEYSWEYASNSIAIPLLKIDYASALAAFIAHGVQVRFVDRPTFWQLEATDAWLSTRSAKRDPRE